MTTRTNPAAGALQAANALRRSVSHLARHLRTLRADHMSLGKVSLLARLHRAGRPMTATQLAARERLQPQSLTRLIADLEQRGLIRRTPDESDRRHLWIDIAPKGSELLRADARRQNAWLARAMAERLTPAERDTLHAAAALLERLADED